MQRLSRPSRLLLAATLLAALGAPPSGGAAEPGLLQWPLPFQEGCTSSFGEYRFTHFHVGVDMRTRQQEGWPVYAVADGTVARVRREPDGYGRVLYLTLDDGRTAVYGHLCRFSRELGIEQRLQAVCAAKGSSFPGDVTFDPPIRVKRGDVVARSGQLGLGSPHLHFELRRGDDVCDPFLEGLPLPAGVGAPEVRGLLFVPRDADGSVEGSFRPAYVSARSTAPGSYRLERAVRVSGAVDARLSARDHLGVATNDTGVPTLEATVDGEEVFSMDLRCVSLAKYKQSTLLFDAAWIPGGSPAYLLRRAAGMEVPGVEGAGLPPGMGEGDHALSVTASNRSGKRATLEGVLRVAGQERGSRPLALPGTGYRLEELQVLPAGLWLAFKRASSSGVTPLLWGGRPVEGMRVEEAGGTIHVLLPREAAPRKGSPLAVGGTTISNAAAAGPCTLTSGEWSLELPAGSLGSLDPKSPGSGEASAVVRCGPASARGEARLSYRGAAARGAGIWTSGRWVRAAEGKPIPFRADGTYLVRQDRTAPRWGGVHLATVPNLGAREVRAVLSDTGSGVNAHGLQVTLDGKPVFPDWDSEAHTVRLDLSGVSPGRHVLAGSCADRAGNRATLEPLTFTAPAGKNP